MFTFTQHLFQMIREMFPKTNLKVYKLTTMQVLTIKGQENGIVIISELNVGLKGLDNDNPSEDKG